MPTSSFPHNTCHFSLRSCKPFLVGSPYGSAIRGSGWTQAQGVQYVNYLMVSQISESTRTVLFAPPHGSCIRFRSRITPQSRAAVPLTAKENLETDRDPFVGPSPFRRFHESLSKVVHIESATRRNPYPHIRPVTTEDKGSGIRSETMDVFHTNSWSPVISEYHESVFPPRMLSILSVKESSGSHRYHDAKGTRAGAANTG